MSSVHDEFAASFRITGKELEPAEITAMMGITPDIYHRKGDQNSSISRKGELIEDAPYEAGLWLIESKLSKQASPEEHLTALLSRLEPAKGQISMLATQSGFSIDFSCRLICRPTQPVVIFSASVLKRIGDLGATLGLDVSPCKG